MSIRNVGNMVDWGSAIEMFFNVGRHWVDFGVQFFLNFDDVLLVSFGDEIDGESDLSKSTWSSDSVKISAAFWREVEVENNINSLNINTSSYQVRANQGLELSFSESIKTFDSFIRFHVRM